MLGSMSLVRGIRAPMPLLDKALCEREFKALILRLLANSAHVGPPRGLDPLVGPPKRLRHDSAAAAVLLLSTPQLLESLPSDVPHLLFSMVCALFFPEPMCGGGHCSLGARRRWRFCLKRLRGSGHHSVSENSDPGPPCVFSWISCWEYKIPCGSTGFSE